MVYFIGVSCVKIEELLVISYFLFVLLRVCLVLRFRGEKEKRAIFNDNAKQIKNKKKLTFGFVFLKKLRI